MPTARLIGASVSAMGVGGACPPTATPPLFGEALRATTMIKVRIFCLGLLAAAVVALGYGERAPAKTKPPRRHPVSGPTVTVTSATAGGGTDWPSRRA